MENGEKPIYKQKLEKKEYSSFEEFYKQFEGNVDLYFAKLNTESFVFMSKNLFD